MAIIAQEDEQVMNVDRRWLEDAKGLEELGRRADAAYERYVKPNISPADTGKFVALDVDTGEFEIDGDELAAEDRLLAQHPGATVWLTRVGSRTAHRLGRTIESV